jgi:GGDEF domain-containing protein
LPQDRVTQAIAASSRNSVYGAIFFIDLDKFKVLNDTHGHDIGDLLLVEVSQRLKQLVRKSDTVSPRRRRIYDFIGRFERERRRSRHHFGQSIWRKNI